MPEESTQQKAEVSLDVAAPAAAPVAAPEAAPAGHGGTMSSGWFLPDMPASAPGARDGHSSRSPKKPDTPSLRRSRVMHAPTGRGSVTTAPEGKVMLESIGYDHGGAEHDSRRLKVTKWLLIVVCGLLTGAVGFILTRLQFFFTTLKISTAESVEGSHGMAASTLVFVGIGTAMVLFAGFLVIFVGPLAAGSGIPFLLAYLNGNAVPNFLSLRTFFTKFWGLVFCIAGGLPLGIEGPFIHIGALCAAAISTLPQRLGFHGSDVNNAIVADIASPSSMRLLVACGAASGVAAAFNAPIAGVLFVQHDAAAFWTADVTLRSFVCCAVASFALIACLSGGQAVMKHHSLIDFRGTRDFTYNLNELFPFALLGIVGGLLGALFTKVNVQLAIRRDKLLARSKPLKLVETAVLGVFVNAVVHLVPRLFSCQAATTGAAENWTVPIGLCTRGDSHGLDVCRQHACAEHEYNELASMLLNIPESVVGLLFDPRPDVLAVETLLVFAATYFLLVTVAYDSSAVGGLFVPSMMIGSSMGRALALILRDLDWAVQPSVFALVGASAVLSGLTRYTLALVVLVVEATQNTTLLLPVVLAVVVAKAVGDLFTVSVYEQRLLRMGVPLVEDHLDAEIQRKQAADVMRRRVLTVRRYARVDKVFNYLLNSTHNGFPVVEHEVGVMHRLEQEVGTDGQRRSRPQPRGSVESTGSIAESIAESVESIDSVDEDGLDAGDDDGHALDADYMMHSLDAGAGDEEYAVPRALSEATFKRSEGHASPPRAPPAAWHKPSLSLRKLERTLSASSAVSIDSNVSRASIDLGGNVLRSHFIGIVTRRQLIHALREGIMHETVRDAHGANKLGDGETMARRRAECTDAALHMSMSAAALDLTTLNIEPQQYKSLIDLSPYIDDGVISVQGHTPMGRVHRLFLSVGLRHLVVTDADNEVKGIITRKDLYSHTQAVAFPLEQPLLRSSVSRALQSWASGDCKANGNGIERRRRSRPMRAGTPSTPSAMAPRQSALSKT